MLNIKHTFILVLPAVMGLSACAHDPEPFAREESYEEQQNAEGQQALRDQQNESDRQAQLASRRDADNREENNRSGDESAVSEDQTTSETAESARERVREASAAARQMDLPTLPTPSIPSTSGVLNR